MSGLREQILAELTPIIEKRVYANIFDLKEAARYLKVSESTLRRMIAAEEVPFFMQRGQYFFRQMDLDRRIDNLVKKKSHKGA